MRSAAVLVLLGALVASGCLTALPGTFPMPRSHGPPPHAGRPTTAACTYPCAVTVAAGTYREFEPSITFDPLDPLTVVVSAAEDLIADAPGYLSTPGIENPVSGSMGQLQTPGSYRIGIHTSHDEGATWTTHFIPWAGNAPLTSAWNLYCVYGDPILFYGPDGVLHLVAVAAQCATEFKADQTFHLIHSASADDGTTWGEPSLIFPGEFLVVADDKPWASIDPHTGRIAVAWSGFIALGFAFQELLVSVSDDGGDTWNLPHVVRTAGMAEYVADLPVYDEPAFNWYTATAWGEDRRLHVAVLGYCTPPPHDLFGALPDCVEDVSSADLEHWTVTPVSRIVNPGRSGSRDIMVAYPAIAVDRSPGAHQGRVYIAYLSAASGDYDAWLRWSDDAGATWSPPLRLHDDPSGNGADQFHLALAVDDRGVVHAGFWDRRADAANLLIQMTWARWDPVSQALTNHALEPAWDPDPAHVGGQFLGDYSMAASDRGRVGFAWDVATLQKPGTNNTNIPWDLDVRAAVLPG